jgi:hypothetical protein
VGKAALRGAISLKKRSVQMTTNILVYSTSVLIIVELRLSQGNLLPAPASQRGLLADAI